MTKIGTIVPENRIYRVRDIISMKDLEALGIDPADALIVRKEVRAIDTGVKRNPREGEYFLSGAIPEAYRAYNDCCSPFYICNLVRVKKVVTFEITHELVKGE